jgi:HMG (high mobility group) box
MLNVILDSALFLPGFPKRPLSAYNWFFKEERKKVLNLDFQSMGREISSRWKMTTAEERKRFQELAKVDAERYKKEVQVYEEEQVLRAKKQRELEDSKLASSEVKEFSVGSAGLTTAHAVGSHDLGRFDRGAASLLAAGTMRGMEEKNHPDAPMRLSPRLAPIAASIESSRMQDLVAVELARRQQQQQLNQMLYANDLQSMQQHQALQNQLALRLMQQNQASQFIGQSNDAILLEQLRRQEQQSTLAAALAQQRGETTLDSREALVNEILLRQQLQQQQQHQALINALSGVSNFGYDTGIGGTLGSGFPSTHLGSPQQQSLPSLHALASSQDALSNESILEALLRRLGQPKPDGER